MRHSHERERRCSYDRLVLTVIFPIAITRQFCYGQCTRDNQVLSYKWFSFLRAKSWRRLNTNSDVVSLHNCFPHMNQESTVENRNP